MRLLILSSLIFAAGLAGAKPKPTGTAVTLFEDVSQLPAEYNTIEGTRMVKQINLGAFRFTLDEPGTPYLAIADAVAGVQTKMQIGREGMGLEDAMFFEGWPYLLDKRGQLWAMDDSFMNNVKIRARPWKPWKSARFWKNLPTAAGFGAIASVLAFFDYYTFQVFFDPGSSYLRTLFTGGSLEVLGAMAVDQARSHREITKNHNFFTRLVAEGVMNLQPLTTSDGQVNDVTVGIREKDGTFRTESLRKLIKSAADGKPITYRKANCVIYLVGGGLG